MDAKCPRAVARDDINRGSRSGRCPTIIHLPPPPERPDRAISSTFLALVALFLLCAVLMAAQPSYARPLAIALVIVGWLISLSLHEFGHAIIAYGCGDRTVRAKGYLTLNPLRYTDLQYSIVWPILIMVVGGVGLPGGAVYVNRQLLTRRVYGALVSAGGPIATAAVLAILLVVLRSGNQVLATAPALNSALAFLALLQLTALAFNLVPCPGLDGWGIIEPFLPAAVRVQGQRLAPVAPLLLMVALFFIPPLNAYFWDAVFGAGALIGLDARLAFQGMRLFQNLARLKPRAASRRRDREWRTERPRRHPWWRKVTPDHRIAAVIAIGVIVGRWAEGGMAQRHRGKRDVAGLQIRLRRVRRHCFNLPGGKPQHEVPHQFRRKQRARDPVATPAALPLVRINMIARTARIAGQQRPQFIEAQPELHRRLPEFVSGVTLASAS